MIRSTAVLQINHFLSRLLCILDLIQEEAAGPLTHFGRSSSGCQVQCPPVPWSSGRSTQDRSGHVPHSVMCIALCSSPRARCTPRPRPQSRRRSRARDSDRVKQDVTRRLPCLHRRDPRAQANQQSMPCRRNAIRSLSVTVRTRNRLILL